MVNLRYSSLNCAVVSFFGTQQSKVKKMYMLQACFANHMTYGKNKTYLQE